MLFQPFRGARLAVFYIVKFSVQFRNKNSCIALMEFLFVSSIFRDFILTPPYQNEIFESWGKWGI